MRKTMFVFMFLLGLSGTVLASITLTPGEGIDITKSGPGGLVTVSGEDASDTNKGIASFNSTDFTASNGVVSLGAIPSVTSISMSGTDTQVCFLDGTSLACGDSDFTWNKTTNTLTLGGSGERWSGVTFGEYIDFNDGGNDCVRLGGSGGTSDITIDMCMDTNAEISPSGGDLKIYKSAGGDIKFFDTTDVDNTAEGKRLRVYRMAAEGDVYIDIYGDNTMGAKLETTSTTLKLNSEGTIQLWDDVSFGASWLTGSVSLKQYGYITAAATSKYVQFDVNDTTDNFELTREDANIGKFDIQMPLITDNIDIGTTPAYASNRKLRVYDDGVQYAARVSIIGTGDTGYPALEFITDASDSKRTLIRHDGEGSNDYGLHFYTTNNGTVGEQLILSGDGNLTLVGGGNFTVNTSKWNSGDSIDGEMIADDTVDDDSIDLGDVTCADLTMTDCASFVVPNGTDLPATCSVGQIFHDTNDDACSDANSGDGALCICKTSNTWALVSNF